MLIYIVDNPSKVALEQGVWIYYPPGEYFVARQTIEAHKEMYDEHGVDTSPLDNILSQLARRENPQ